MKPEAYFSVDIETAGPIAGKYSMLSLGASLVGQPEVSHYVELKPISMEFVPAALEVSGFDLKHLAIHGDAPASAMPKFKRWVETTAGERKPVFAGFNAVFDWQFVNWYLVTFAGENPFGFGGIDIKSYYMGLAGVPWAQTSSSQLPEDFQPDLPQTHNALDDARAQASIFEKLLRASRRR